MSGATRPEVVCRLSRRYAAFAEETRDQSPAYERLARATSSTPEVLRFIANLPPERRQPNLFFAAIRQLHGVPGSIKELAEVVRNDGDRVTALMLSRTTQTNEPARCAVLLPLLAGLPQPLALLEVGAAAGLCLVPDRYGYDYRVARIEPPHEKRAVAPVFHCAVSGPVQLPRAHPSIVWRRGLDLNPLDLHSQDDLAWLQTLVWPGQEDRLQRLRAAIDIARLDPPHVVRGDLQTALEPLMASAPKDATLVVFHTAVLAYVRRTEDRQRFAMTLRRANAVWISNEAPEVFPSLAPAGADVRGRFLMMQNGTAIAWAGPHGQSLEWIASP